MNESDLSVYSLEKGGLRVAQQCNRHLLLVFLVALAVAAVLPVGAEEMRMRPEKSVEVDPAPAAAIAKAQGVSELPPQVKAALEGEKEKALFSKLVSELRQASFVLKYEKFSGPLKDSLAFAREKGQALEELPYAHVLIRDSETSFTGGAVPWLSIAIGAQRATILQDGSTQEIL